jgi:uncharacterized protein
VVTNVTAFGAFVDVGVHQDGLVHVSQLADRFVKDPHEVVKVGDKLKVRVLEIDLARKRIALTAKSGQQAPRASQQDAAQNRLQNTPQNQGNNAARHAGARRQEARPQANPSSKTAFSNTPFANLLKK